MRKIFLVMILLTVTAVLFGEEALFRVIEDATVRGSRLTGGFRRDEFTTTIKKGEIVTGYYINYSKKIIDGCYVYENAFTYNDCIYHIRTDMLVPADTNSLFDDFWITSFDSNDNVFWVRDCYLSVLFSKDRNVFYKFEYKYIDGYNVLMEALGYDMMEEEWYEDKDIGRCLEINQTTMYAGGFNIREFWIKNIININNGYKITVIDSRFGETGGIDDSYHWNPILFPTDKPSFSLLLIRDNDYVDMYLDTMENKLATFVLVDKTVVNELNSLLKNNTCDLSKITSLPRRADGSMDYPPPDTIWVEDKMPESAIERKAVIQNSDNTAIAENARKGMVFRVIMIASIAVLLGGGVVVVVVLRKKAG